MKIIFILSHGVYQSYSMKCLSLVTVYSSFIALARANNWATYPSVAKSASINGFADPIYTKLPECGQECVDIPTDNTPCPYWDTGCFCVMPQWAGLIGECFASKCSGDDVASATSLALSLCSSVGANMFLVPASITAVLNEAAAGKAQQEATTTDSSASSTSISESSIQLGSESTTENLAMMSANYDILSVIVVLLATLFL